ncbi:MAG: ABC transporter ATP-binding protein [Rhodovibrionaceae bacterium]|nr:ABC transporter ATP-binding protein [Rhodovibrionaceae bacterium]
MSGHENDKAEEDGQAKRDGQGRKRSTSGYGVGNVDTVMSVDEVARQAGEIADQGPGRDDLEKLCDGDAHVKIEGMRAGYGKMQILHEFELLVGAGQSLCLIGPNGAGKSTVLHTIFGFTNIYAGTVTVGDLDVTKMSPKDKLKHAGVAYILQDNSVFPDLTVEENLLMGGYLMDTTRKAKEAAERIFSKYERLAERKNQRAGVLSGGERRLLEISRALIMEPSVLLVDEPSIGLEPRFIDMVFEILDDLQNNENKTIVMVEQNAKKGLEFADIGYVLVSGQLAMAGPGSELLEDPQVGKLFLGG